jgi:ABC-type long-subunit fatty acid transport system fused permease/ATPase subunit
MKMTARLVVVVIDSHSSLIKLLLSLLNQLLLLMQLQKRVNSLSEIVNIEKLLHLVGIVVV